jgi:protocatechuate 3,4-dioxygenase beta subunit
MVDEAPESPSPDPAPAPEVAPSPAGKPPDRRLRLAIGGVVAALIATLVIVLVMRQRPTHHTVVATPRDGGAAKRAPSLPTLPPGQGVKLAGVVVDGAGAPVEGAEVTIEREVDTSAPGGRMLPPAPAGPAGSAASLPLDAGLAPSLTAPTTGADGAFTLDGLEPGRYRLRVTGPGLLTAELRMLVVPTDQLRVVVARQVTIEGTVTDGGKPVAAAMVGVRGDAIGGTIEVKTGTDGTFAVPNVPEGSYQVFAYQGALAARAMRVVRLGAGPFPKVELRLEAAAIVVGRVVDRDEGTGVIAAVELRPATDDDVPRYARSGDDGVFRIEGVPNGRWVADAYAPGYLSPGGIELEAGRGVPEIALEAGGVVEGRVLDGEGKPVAGAAVRGMTAGDNPTEVSALVDRDQLRRFSGRTAAPLQSSPTPFANDPDFVPRGELGVLLGPIPAIPPPGVVAARPASIVDPRVISMSLAGEPDPLPVDPARASIWTTGADGHYRVRGLIAGKLSMLAAATGYAEARSRELTIKPGQHLTDVDIVLTAGTYLFGKVSDPRGAAVAGAQVTAVPELGLPLDTFTDGDGMYRLGPVTGKLLLSATAYGHVSASRSLDVAPSKGRIAGEQREDITLEAADAILAGTLDDATGAAVGGAHIEIIGGAGEGRSVVVAADGTFSLDMLPRGKLRVRVTHPSYPPAELDATASSTGVRSRLRLALGGQIEGALLDGASGSPLAAMTIDARGPAGMSAETATDDKGLWKLGPLRPGTWHLTIKQPGFLAFTRDVDVPVSSAPGETSVRDVRIELQRGALVGGTVRDQRGQRVAGAEITVRRADGTGAPVEADADDQGEFRIHDCPTGELIVSAKKGDMAGSTSTMVRPGAEVLSLSIEVR